MIRVDLPRFRSFEAWRAAARQLASNRVAADEVRWAAPDDPAELFGAASVPGLGAQPVVATKDLLDLARQVSSHSDPERWGLLYAALMRTQEDRRFLSNPADPMRNRLERMAKSVRRDIHKMHAFVRFHELPSKGSRRSFGAWFEPEHPILEAGTPFFAKRFADMDWLIATPEGIARFEGEAIGFEPPAPRPDLPEDASHDLWQTYFANIFNPARIKTQAMRSEMPVKYWKNLPETRLIGEMLADAPRRVQAMADAGATEAPAFAAKVTARLRQAPDDSAPDTMEAARAQALRCRRCDLCQHATQTVWGEGDPQAPLMIVGEAPGDHEDLAGRPFVGPAGQLLRQAMAETGIDPERAWLTNAVKHFKFRPRGKRRLHQNPNAGEVQHCRWWLGLERRFVAPRVTVALGATAAYALTGNRDPLTPRRGGVENGLIEGPVLITWHPSMILRETGPGARVAREQLVSDLIRARRMLAG
ncbi:UdgX family uracil-DNA binding protein [Paracoccus sediminicola]|uniref:UdgX family uracil-DNA binding protein n=1 Tax=Paracoccus sediminicola TaxID=3017783 RepID=UPI0022F0B8D4|nr:UdgX family uracil-DNA binding protein [Paracoccus sediminicola]WBU57365.1 UdgX family uracil-DNA binding protein [Paracoccus sediminicola]